MNRPLPPRGNSRPRPEEQEPATDWLAWSLQLAFGFVVAAGIGFQVGRSLFRSGAISLDQVFCVAAGTGLGCGAIAAYFGDRVWMQRSIWDPPEPPRSRTAWTASVCVGAFGVLLVLGPMALHLPDPDHPGGSPSLAKLSQARLILAAVPCLLLVYALRTGNGFWRFGNLDRDKMPLFYWSYVLLLCLGVMRLLFGR